MLIKQADHRLVNLTRQDNDYIDHDKIMATLKGRSSTKSTKSKSTEHTFFHDREYHDV